jgi:hypothetical protein
MKSILYIVLFIFCTGCNRGQKPNKIFSFSDTNIGIKITDTSRNTANQIDYKQREVIQFTAKQLEAYLDSIGNCSTQKWIEKVSFYSDSIFYNQQKLYQSVSKNDFKKLIRACRIGISDPDFKKFKPDYRTGKLDINTAKKIFKYTKFREEDFYRRDTIFINFIPFDSQKFNFNEFAIYIGNPFYNQECDLYFFKSKKIIAKHTVNHRYGLELKHYSESDGKTIIYYKENYCSGSGIWWFNYYFYKYSDTKLIPILNEIGNGNIQLYMGLRIQWIQSFIQNTNPLTIKMVYYQDLCDSNDKHYRIIDDSTIIKYHWEKSSNTLVGDYGNSKMNKQQILTYYVSQDNEILFINSYSKILKEWLSKSNSKKREVVLNYLNNVKNGYGGY